MEKENYSKKNNSFITEYSTKGESQPGIYSDKSKLDLKRWHGSVDSEEVIFLQMLSFLWP